MNDQVRAHVRSVASQKLGAWTLGAHSNDLERLASAFVDGEQLFSVASCRWVAGGSDLKGLVAATTYRIIFIGGSSFYGIQSDFDPCSDALSKRRL